MPIPAERTRRRILDAAYELFYRKGYSRVGVDEIAPFAGVTKRTLYYHFESKDQLLGSVLALHSELALARIGKYEGRYSGSPDQIIEVLFSELAKWSAKPDWAGAGFTRLVMELADLKGHPARAIAHRHKAAMEAWLASLLEKAGVSCPLDRAREVALLIEGATALILIHGDRSYAEAAGRAAKRLVSGSYDQPESTPPAPDGNVARVRADWAS
jgi:AcrR family transcriptional regulator